MIDYKMCEMAKRVRSKAAAVIKNESDVVQSSESRVAEAMDVINLCNMIISAYESNRGPINFMRDRDEPENYTR